jgi:hypothetical protein
MKFSLAMLATLVSVTSAAVGNARTLNRASSQKDRQERRSLMGGKGGGKGSGKGASRDKCQERQVLIFGQDVF